MAAWYPMSAWGQKPTSRRLGATSALTSKVDINRRRYDVCFVPKADMGPDDG